MNGIFAGVIFVFLAILIFIIAEARKFSGSGRRVKAQFISQNSGRTMYAGHGNSVGSAVVDGFSKMYHSVSINSQEGTIQSRLNSMTSTLSENRSRMRSSDIVQCEHYIREMSNLLSQKRAQRQAKEHERSEAELEKIRQRMEKAEVLEQKRQEKEAGMTERQRYIAEQRKILTASMRYDVLCRDNYRCVICGASAKDGAVLHVDHIIPLAKGGKSEMSNLQTLCDRCNLGKGTKAG